MLTKRKFICAAAAMLLAVWQGTPGRAADGPSDIVTTAVAAGSFNTLAAALKAAGLVETLQKDGPFTVFAPTDEAFAKLPDGTVESLLKPENKAKLTAVLTYHVVSGKKTSGEVAKLKSVATVNGQQVDILVENGGVKIDQAQVVKADIACSNGVIHVIDQVVLPSFDNIPATAEKAGTFKTLLAAAAAAGLVPVLSGDQPLTVFAPTDEAFEKLPAGTVEGLLKPENREKLASILKFHVVPGRVFSNEAVAKKTLKTVQGGNLLVEVKASGATVNGSRLVATDIDASNGVIHVVDSVLLPPAPAKAAAAAPAQTRAVYKTSVCPKTGRVTYHTVRASH